MTRQFFAGERVQIDWIKYSNPIGTVVFQEDASHPVLVEFDAEFHFTHNGGGRTPSGRGFWCAGHSLTLIFSEEKAPKPDNLWWER